MKSKSLRNYLTYVFGWPGNETIGTTGKIVPEKPLEGERRRRRRDSALDDKEKKSLPEVEGRWRIAYLFARILGVVFLLCFAAIVACALLEKESPEIVINILWATLGYFGRSVTSYLGP